MFGMRHQADDAAVGRAHARDAAHRAVEVLAIAEDHAVLALELVEHGFGGDVAALPRLQRDQQVRAGVVPGCPGRGVGGHLQPRVTADEMQAGVAGQRTGQQARPRTAPESRCRYPAPACRDRQLPRPSP